MSSHGFSNVLSYSGLIEQLEELADAPSAHIMAEASIRKRLYNATRKVNLALEQPGDTIHRIGSLPLQSAMARVGCELNLFEIIVKSGGNALSSRELAEKTGVDPILMRRMLQYYAAFAMITEIGEDQFVASNISKAMVPTGLKNGINYFFETISGTFISLPKFLRETKYQNASDPSYCPWQIAHATDQPPFQWLQSHPEDFGYFISWMTAQREGLATWLNVFPSFEDLCCDLKPETKAFVDIGGAGGHQCLMLIDKFPHLKGHVILQDTPQVIGHGVSLDGIESMIYDFWTPQPIIGARAYYMRNVLHDWPDHKCIEILRNTRSAMTKESVLLIDEMIIPATGAHWRAMQLDINMLTCLAAQERSAKQWTTLLGAAGLKIIKVYSYTEELQDSIVVAISF